MIYNRLELIYNGLDHDMRKKFREMYNLPPCELDYEPKHEIEQYMEQFIEFFGDNPAIRRLCEIYPDVRNVPHPDLITESQIESSRTREILKYAYIQRLELENLDLMEANRKLKRKIDELTDIIVELNSNNEPAENCNELAQQTADQSERTVEPSEQTVELGDGMVQRSMDEFSLEDTIAAEIYNKLFVSPVAKYRYGTLSKENIVWIYDHVNLPEPNRKIFEACCESDSLKEVSNKLGCNLSSVKRGSAAIIESIKLALISRIHHKDHQDV